MRVVAITTTFRATQFQALDQPPDLVCSDFATFLSIVQW
jgi:hypothetical protein